jgi:thiol-disulfide isomerase/thioredoxin
MPPTVSPAPTPSAPVPFCVLTGRKLDNFALNDLNGQPWEYRKDRRGKLVLLDFWKTSCVPCLHAIPHLNGWRQTYGPYGLEVVGIAYETGSHEEKVRRIRSLRYSPAYTVLLGTSPAERCPVKNQFQALYFPTLVLLDETGQIVWRGEGLDAQQLRELEFEIKRRLGLR